MASSATITPNVRAQPAAVTPIPDRQIRPGFAGMYRRPAPAGKRAGSRSCPRHRNSIGALAAVPLLPGPGYLSGVRVGVALVRVCFMKNAGLVIRQ